MLAILFFTSSQQYQLFSMVQQIYQHFYSNRDDGEDQCFAEITSDDDKLCRIFCFRRPGFLLV